MTYTKGIHLPVIEQLSPIPSSMGGFNYFQYMPSVFWLGNKNLLVWNKAYSAPYIYNIDNDSWGAISYSTWGVSSLFGYPNNCSFAAVFDRSKNKLYQLIYGGTARFFPLDISTMTWGTTTANGNETASCGAQIIHTDNTYISGLDDNAFYVKPSNSSTSFLKYDSSTNSWTTLANMPYSNGFLAFFPAIDSNHFYYFEHYWRNYYVYDIANNTWSTQQHIVNPPTSTGSSDTKTAIALDFYGTETVLGTGNVGKNGYILDSGGNIWKVTLNNSNIPVVEPYRTRPTLASSFTMYPVQNFAYVEAGGKPFLYWAIGSASSTSPSYYFFRTMIT